MTTRSTPLMPARPGGKVEYHGDLPNIVASNYDPKRDSAMGQRLTVPAMPARSRAAFVDGHDRLDGFRNFYSYGAIEMARPIPGQPGYGSVIPSAFQRYNVRLLFWQIITSLHSGGYPRNLGLSTAVPQPETNASGGAGSSVMTQRGLFTRVQTVGRPRAVVQRFDTRSANR